MSQLSDLRQGHSHSCDCRVYVHCTAGLGRAPAVCIAYVHWFGDYHDGLTLDLDEGMVFCLTLPPPVSLHAKQLKSLTSNSVVCYVQRTHL